MHVRPSTWEGRMASERKNEYSFSTTMEIGGQFVCAQGDSIVFLGAGATANLVCFEVSGNRNSGLHGDGFRKSESISHVGSS